MKVGPIELANTAAGTAAERAERRASGTGGRAAEPSAKVDLSTSAVAIGAGVDASFDQVKVDRIAQAIRDGKFEVNADAIADRLIANARELLGKSSS